MTLTEESISDVSEKARSKNNMSKKQIFYYRIFDDTEKLNYMKSSLPHQEVEHWLREYERTHQKYFNPEFINYLHEHDPEAEIIEISDISY